MTISVIKTAINMGPVNEFHYVYYWLIEGD